MEKKHFAVLAAALCFCSASLVQADTIGNAVDDREIFDAWYDFTTIDKDLVFTDSGVITSWSIYAGLDEKNNGGNGDNGGVYLQVLRNTSGNTYEIIGENYFDNVVAGSNTWAVELADQITFSAGDYIGFSVTGDVKIDFDYTGEGHNEVYHSSLSGSYRNGVGNSVELATYFQDRTYSISAETASSIFSAAAVPETTTPVPEPTTLILFGTGIAGLAAVGRKRKE